MCPPSTTITCPVINAACGDIRNETAVATSSGLPSLFSGVALILELMNSSPAPFVISVSMFPGATPLTLIKGANSFANERVKFMTPAFAAVYATTGAAPIIPYVEAIFTMFPPCCSRRMGAEFLNTIESSGQIDINSMVPGFSCHFPPAAGANNSPSIVH